MAQVPCEKKMDNAHVVPYYAATAVAAGDVVLYGTVPLPAPVAIPAGTWGDLACDGVWKVPKTSDTFNQGDTVYWNATGDPVGGTVSTGAADSATGYPMGKAVACADYDDGSYSAATAAAEYLLVTIDAIKVVGTVAGAATATGITGADSSLEITGIAGSSGAGGAIA
ncbi:MAG: hypothetical protein A2V98_11565, partial [Planctomycetes bacterium RBG_16_64_12]